MAETSTTNPKKVEEFLRTSRDRFRLASDAERELREEGRKDDRFRAGEAWPTDIKQSRDRDGRPCLHIDKLSQPLRQVTNQQRQAKPSIQINPVGGGADKATAEIQQGLIRQIEQDSFADVAYDWAFDGAVSRGWGYFRVLTDYEDDNSFDQVIKIDWIEDAYSVYFDPGAKMWNRSDALWCHVITDLTNESYDARYGYKEDVSSSKSLQHFTGIGNDQPDWFPDNGIRIAEYFYVNLEEVEMALLDTGEQIEASQLKKKQKVMSRRPLKRRKIGWCIHNAVEIIEKGEWAGKFIPIIEVEGERLRVDGKIIKRGLIRNAQDPQRMYDYWVSTATETTALAPRAPWLMYEGQDENYETMWANANTKSYSSLKVRATTRATGNQILPLPQRILAEPPIQAMMAGIKQSELDIHSVTAFYDASDPRRSTSEQSGKAVLARKEQGQITNANFQDNFGRSLRYLGEILLDLMPKIYDRPGRVVQIVGMDDEVRQVMLNQPFQQGAEGKPEALPEGAVFQQGLHQFYDLKNGQYNVTVTVGATYTTRRQEAVVSMLQLIEANPNMAPMISDVLVENMDWPGSTKLADRLKKMLPPPLQEQEQGQPSSQQLQAQMQQMGMQLQQLQQIAQQQAEELKANTAKIQADERIAAADRQSKETIAAMQAQTQILINADKMAAQQNTAAVKANLDRVLALLDTSQRDKELNTNLAIEAQREHNAAMTEAVQAARPPDQAETPM